MAIGDRSRHFEPLLSDKDDTGAGTSLLLTSTPKEARLSLDRFCGHPPPLHGGWKFQNGIADVSSTESLKCLHVEEFSTLFVQGMGFRKTKREMLLSMAFGDEPVILNHGQETTTPELATLVLTSTSHYDRTFEARQIFT
ncbi:hypothetical protein TNCV_185551 [Trichonephila clavipes]|nr:hypothetical protein TNCV_185551 [Trichonephila clavipes]